jgi:guanylate kinase
MQQGAANLFVVTAPSGAGKTTLCNELIRRVPNIRYAVSHTTRKARDNEADGKNYHFVAESTFKEMIAQGRFFEWAVIHGNHYGTSIDEYEKAQKQGVDLLLEIEGEGAMQVKNKHADAVLTYIVAPTPDDLKKRLNSRGKDSPEEIERRLLHAKKEMAFLPNFQYVIINDDLEDALLRLTSIVYAWRSLRKTMMPQLSDEYKLP